MLGPICPLDHQPSPRWAGPPPPHGLIQRRGLSQPPPRGRLGPGTAFTACIMGAIAAPLPRFDPQDTRRNWLFSPLPDSAECHATGHGIGFSSGYPQEMTQKWEKVNAVWEKPRCRQINSPSHPQTLLGHSGTTWPPETSLPSKQPAFCPPGAVAPDICFSSFLVSPFPCALLTLGLLPYLASVKH